MEIDTTTHKTNGRKTANAALMMLVLTLCAGMIVRPMLVSTGEDVAYYRQIRQWSDSCD